jgi:hypothetical protein
MNNTAALKDAVLREKLLLLLRNGIPSEIKTEINFLITQSGKRLNILDIINGILEETPQYKLLYSDDEWAAAYIIVHKQEKLKELIDKYEISRIKCKHNNELWGHISSMIHNMNELSSKFAVEIKEIRNEDIFNDVLSNLEKINQTQRYLIGLLDEIEKENRQLFEEIRSTKENIREAIMGILERL